MKSIQWLSQFALVTALVGISRAEEIGVVQKDNVNVRGLPSFQGEIITQLKQGEKVIVLGEIAVAKPKEGEPAKWFKIQMPTNTPVWINATFVDAQTKTVKPFRLNLRGGPGENYSIVGRLQRGDLVKEIRTVEGWSEIETPPGAFGYVAADFVKKEAQVARTVPPVVAVEEKKTEPTLAVAPPTPAPVQPPPAIERTVPQDAAPIVPVTPLKIEAPPPAALATPAITPAPVAPVTVISPPVPPAVAQPLSRRVVRREGIVRRALSIQAPTYYELVGSDSGKVVNYLHLPEAVLEKLGTDIKQFRDYLGRSVIVSGEEGIDSRWPNTPVIEVETLKLVL